MGKEMIKNMDTEMIKILDKGLVKIKRRGLRIKSMVKRRLKIKSMVKRRLKIKSMVQRRLKIKKIMVNRIKSKIKREKSHANLCHKRLRKISHLRMSTRRHELSRRSPRIVLAGEMNQTRRRKGFELNFCWNRREDRLELSKRS